MRFFLLLGVYTRINRPQLNIGQKHGIYNEDGNAVRWKIIQLSILAIPLTEAQANHLSCQMSKNNNARGGFTGVEVLLVVSAILVFAYCCTPVVQGVGRGLGKWMSTPSAKAAKTSGTPQCCAPAAAPAPAPANAAAEASVLKTST